MELTEVGRYYSEKLGVHGASPQGVDWNGAESQHLRFDQMARLCQGTRTFSANDIGCGYGALFDHLTALGHQCDYLGVDIAPAMVAKAEELHRRVAGCRFAAGARAGRMADYVFASGIFNVKLSAAHAAWHAHVLETLAEMNATSRRGFAFNCLTRYSDVPLMLEHLFYADPCELFDHCKTRFARDVALLHDYGLYEFTILVRKAPP